MNVTALDDGRIPTMSLGRRLVAEMLGTSFLLIAVVGSAIAGERLAAGNTALVLLADALATGAALFVLIEWLAPISGAHFNPLITLALLFRGDITGRVAAAYVPIQLLGAGIGVAVADVMFDAPVLSLSTHVRSGLSQMLGEFVAAFGLVGAVWTCSRTRPSSLAGVVAVYIFGVFWFTPTGFANPAVTIARAFTDTFSGIRPADVPGFIVGQFAGTVAAVAVFQWLVPNTRTSADNAYPTAATDHRRQPGDAVTQTTSSGTG